MKTILCKLGIHNWRYPNPFARICKRCNRLDEVHNDCIPSETWDLFNSKGDYWVTTRKSRN